MQDEVRMQREIALQSRVSEIENLIASCYQQGNALGFRDAAAIAILRCGGIRRQEMVRLKCQDLCLKTGELTILGGEPRYV